MKVRDLVLSLAFLAGCSTTLELDSRFRPLVRVRENPALPPGRVSTILETVLVRSLEELLDARPRGSVELDALLFHERVHALHQIADPNLLALYARDPGTRWVEEQAGWKVELQYLRDHGRPVDVEWVADTLANNYGGMVSRPDAEAWVLAVLKEPTNGSP